MNWRYSLCEKILAVRSAPAACRDTAVMWASELSAICDRWVPNAAEPVLLGTVSDDIDMGIGMSWYGPGDDPTKFSQRGTLHLMVRYDERVMMYLSDGDQNVTVYEPPHCVLKTSVRSFFERFPP